MTSLTAKQAKRSDAYRIQSSATEHENALREERAGEARAGLRRGQMDFATNDASGDGQLDLGEFAAMLPESMRESHTQQEIKVWFDALDSSADGRIDACEFFLFSLRHTARRVGTRLEDVFRRYDKSGEGKLDKFEFSKAV
eukprot:3216956-Prymnesium_polylepis.1